MRKHALIMAGSMMIICFATSVKANFVLNGGFETGDFTDWKYSSSDQFSFVSDGFSHTGNYAAWFGDSLEDGGGSLSQSLATIIGGQYTLSFWFAGNGDTPSGFTALVGGTTLFSTTNPPLDTIYNFYSFSFAATSASTLLQFNFYDDPFYINLDDVSVDPLVSTVPEPSSAALLGISLLALAASYMHSRQMRCGRFEKMKAPTAFTR